jgi:hypothetical protein
VQLQSYFSSTLQLKYYIFKQILDWTDVKYNIVMSWHTLNRDIINCGFIKQSCQTGSQIARCWDTRSEGPSSRLQGLFNWYHASAVETRSREAARAAAWIPATAYLRYTMQCSPSPWARSFLLALLFFLPRWR